MTVETTEPREAPPVGVGHLTVRQEGDDEYIIGDMSNGTFFSVPELGARIIGQLSAGRTADEIRAALLAETGHDVDVDDFVDGLVAAGLASSRESVGRATRSGVGDTDENHQRTTPRTWVASRVPSRLARPLFSRAAWLLYGSCFIGTLALFVAEPALVPSSEALFFTPSVLTSLLTSASLLIVTGVVHELWHALAGAALGIPSRFRISRRAAFVVFETDLSRMWAVASRQRYGPLLAGLGIDSVLLFVAVAIRFGWSHGWLETDPRLIRVLGTVVLLQSFRMTFQGLAFMRTDLYLVLATALGARNLHRIARLSLRRMARLRLTPAERQDLDGAHPRDLALARWYRLLYVAGLAWIAWFLVTYGWPSIKVIMEWSVAAMANSTPASPEWWQAVVLVAFESWFFGVPLVLLIRERLSRRREVGRA